jgi:hypothetical protein
MQARSGSEDVAPVMAIWVDVMVYLLQEGYKNGLRDGINPATVSHLLYHNGDL